METAFDYLNRVHDDLLEVAKRERAHLRPMPGGPPRRRVPWGGLVAASVTVLLVAGVIGSGLFGGVQDEAGSGARPADETGAGAATGATGAFGEDSAGLDPMPVPGGVVADDAAVGGGAGGEEAPTPPPITRVIRTAEVALTIPRDSFDQRFGEVVDAAEESGGFVADSSSRNRSGNLTIRVPAERFDETLRVLRALGTVEYETLRGKDVTADYVDLRARLRISKARLEVLLGLMQEATSIEQTIRVQNALDETQLRIEQIQGQLRLLDDRTSLATITVVLNEQGVEREVEVETPSIPNALERAVAGAVGVIAAIVIGLGYLLPLLVLGLIGWFVVVWVQRRRSRT